MLPINGILTDIGTIILGILGTPNGKIYIQTNRKEIHMRNSNTTIIDFYDGAYGPTIRVDVQAPAWLTLLKNLLIQIKNKKIAELDLLSLEGVEPYSISGLKLNLGLTSSLSLLSPVKSEKYASFQWTVGDEDIEFMISAINRLIHNNEPGHYYFNEQGDFLVELAYKE